MINYVMLRNSDHLILGVGAVSQLSDMADMARIKSAYVLEVDADIAKNIENYFYDGKEFQLKPPKPIEAGDWHFDNTTLQWVDLTPIPVPLTLDEIKAQKWAEIKSQRDKIEFGGFEFEGNIFDSDVTAQARISAAASLGAAVDWTTQSNEVVSLSATQLTELLKALAAHVAAIHERGRIARIAIFQATTEQEVSAVIL